MTSRRRPVVSLTLLVLASLPALAQNPGGSAARVILPGVQTDDPGLEKAPAYGTASTSSVSLAAHAFAPFASGETYALGALCGNYAIFSTGVGGASHQFVAPVSLPTGALIEHIQFRFRDVDSDAHFESYLVINDKNGSFTENLLVTSTDVENFGCTNRGFTPASPIPVDNENNAYSLVVNLDVSGGSIAICQARIRYRLQVSPAPAVATFLDVPTNHPRFQFVEALVAAGITGGCGGGNFCPDSPLTRSQMAIFLSLALGLHFPN